MHYAVRDGSLAQVEDLVLRLWRLRLEDEANAETQISLYASGSLAEMVRERQKEEDEEAVLIRVCSSAKFYLPWLPPVGK